MQVVAAVAMRQKAFLLFAACILLTCIFIIMLPSTTRHHSFKTIVKETQNKITNLRDNIISAGDQLASGTINLSLQLEARYLEQLGLDPALEFRQLELLDTVVVTGVEPGRAEFVPGFQRSVSQYLPDSPILMYDLGLTRYEKALVSQTCNSTLCTVVEFQFSLWPDHVRDLKLQAYRPIAIQQVLRESGLALWLDLDYRVTFGDLSSWIDRAKQTGIQAWPQEPLTKDTGGGVGATRAATATTSLTHPKMFDYFPDVTKEDYEFQHMVSGSCLLLVDSPALRLSLLTPWLRCVLTEDCINPIGAQSTGCRFDKKPQYRYSGCHKYDVSALNIVLGQMFKLREAAYMGQDSFFRKVDEDALATTQVTGAANTTDWSRD